MTAPAKKTAPAKAKPAVTTRSKRANALTDQGPLYEVLSLSQIDNQLVGPGTATPQVVYFGLPGSNLRALNDEARSRKGQVRDIRNGKGTPEQKQVALTALSDAWNGVEKKDEFADPDDDGDANDSNGDDAGDKND